MIGLVDGNNFFVSCERVVNPKLNGKPVAVLSNNDDCCVAREDESQKNRKGFRFSIAFGVFFPVI